MIVKMKRILIIVIRMMIMIKIMMRVILTMMRGRIWIMAMIINGYR